VSARFPDAFGNGAPNFVNSYLNFGVWAEAVRRTDKTNVITKRGFLMGPPHNYRQSVESLPINILLDDIPEKPDDSHDHNHNEGSFKR
jgi:hypothetical protein